MDLFVDDSSNLSNDDQVKEKSVISYLSFSGVGVVLICSVQVLSHIELWCS